MTASFRPEPRIVQLSIDESRQITARAEVYPIGVRHFHAVRDAVGDCVKLWAQSQDVIGMTGVKQSDGTVTDERVSVLDAGKLADIVSSDLVPRVFGPLWAVFAECVALPDGCRLDDVPHWEVARAVREWVLVSFFPIEKKLRPWADIIGTAIKEADASGRSTTPSVSSSDAASGSPTS